MAGLKTLGGFWVLFCHHNQRKKGEHKKAVTGRTGGPSSGDERYCRSQLWYQHDLKPP